MTVDRRLLGLVEVDSGTLLLGDPAYCLPHAKRDRPGIDYAAVLETDELPATILVGLPVLLLSCFGGDGTFPVLGELEDGVLVRATIEFTDPAEQA